MCWTIHNYDFDIVALQEIGEGGRVAKAVLHQLKTINPTWRGRLYAAPNLAGGFLWRETHSLKILHDRVCSLEKFQQT